MPKFTHLMSDSPDHPARSSIDSETGESTTKLLNDDVKFHDSISSSALTNSPTKTKPRRLFLVLLALLALCCTISLISTAFSLHKLSLSSSSSFSSGPSGLLPSPADLDKHTALPAASTDDLGGCGASETVSEARALGCVFDPMGWAWVRPECYDPALAAEYLNRTKITWHTDPKLTPETEVPREEAIRGDYPRLFTQRIYHHVHCMYMWKRMQKALLQGQPIDTYTARWHHTDHCDKVLLNDIFHEDVECTPEMVCPTWVRASWTACRRYH